MTLLCAATLLSQASAEDLPDSAALERDAARIGTIRLEKANVFDLSNPEEDNWLYRLANRWHVVTKDRVIKKQLLFESGDEYSGQRVEESERILRGNTYLYDARIEPVGYENGVVDLVVRTRDVWTLSPDISVSRSGGENRTKFGLEDTNLLGRGQLIRVARVEDVERTSKSIEFADKHLGSSWVSGFFKVADNSDGDLFLLSAVRPFYSLDTRWSAGGTVIADERRDALYFLGDEAAEYQLEREYGSAFGGWSRGFDGGWVRRWTAGVVHDESRFFDVPNPTLPAAIPEDRKLVYGFVGLEILEDQFETSKNHDQIEQTEDFYMGTRFAATLGWSDEAFGADRDALIYTARASHGFGSLDRNALLLSMSAAGRIESGDTRNAIVAADLRYYRKQSAKWLFFATLSGTAGHALDLDTTVQLGGDSGLRGYPLRYQSGESKLLLTLEQRYFTDWYPFRLVRIGAAVFADVGRVWGRNPLGDEPYEWLSDVGLGLRFAPTRSSTGKMIHLDIAFPLGGESSIDSVQFLLESKRRF